MGAVLCAAPVAAADTAAETALAERYAPVVRLVDQPEECGPGEPYIPTDVDVLFDEPTVAFRGPWNRTDLVKIAPAATDLVNRYEYHLDFPGNPLDAGCDYERWARRLTKGTSPTVYAHVASDSRHPGKLALQYWFFYPFNDFNNTHEGDWEMIQLDFAATTAEEAAARDPVEVGYSSHEGAERATWGDEKLEIVDGTHPVVYPAAGSHANKYTAALHLGSSAEAGVGCDDTLGPHREVRPVVQTIPGDPAEAKSAFPWIAFEGRWGELEKAFFNGPTGPNLKDQWTHPIEWSETWRDRGYAVPTAGIFGTGATDLFCTGVAKGSKGLVLLLRNPSLMLLAFGALLALLVFAVVRATWLPVAPLRVARRRTWGQILSASATMYVERARLFLGIGVVLIPIAAAITLLQWLVFEGIDAARCRDRCRSRRLRAHRGRDRYDAGAPRARARPGGDRLRTGRDRRGPPARPGAGLSDRPRANPSTARGDRALRHRLDRSHRHGDPDPRRPVARRPLVPSRPGRRAGGTVVVRSPAPERPPGPGALDRGRLPRRPQRCDRPRLRGLCSGFSSSSPPTRHSRFSIWWPGSSTRCPSRSSHSSRATSISTFGHAVSSSPPISPPSCRPRSSSPARAPALAPRHGARAGAGRLLPQTDLPASAILRLADDVL